MVKRFQVKARRLGHSQIVSIPKPYRVQNGAYGNVKCRRNHNNVYITYQFKQHQPRNVFATQKWQRADFSKIYHDSQIPLDSGSVGYEKW